MTTCAANCNTVSGHWVLEPHLSHQLERYKLLDYGVCDAYSLEIELTSPHLLPTHLLNSWFCLQDHGLSAQIIWGFCRSWRYQAEPQSGFHYILDCQSPLWPLKQTSGPRVFRNLSPQQIIERLFKNHAIELDIISSADLVIPMRIQPESSDWTFIQALLEEFELGLSFVQNTTGVCCQLFRLKDAHSSMPCLEVTYASEHLQLELGLFSLHLEAALETCDWREARSPYGPRLYQARGALTNLRPGQLLTLQGHLSSDYQSLFQVLAIQSEVQIKQGYVEHASESVLSACHHYKLRALSDPAYARSELSARHLQGYHLARIVAHPDTNLALDAQGRYSVQFNFTDEKTLPLERCQPFAGRDVGFHLPLSLGTEVLVALYADELESSASIIGVPVSHQAPSDAQKMSFETPNGHQLQLSYDDDSAQILFCTPNKDQGIQISSHGCHSKLQLKTQVGDIHLLSEKQSLWQVTEDWQIEARLKNNRVAGSFELYALDGISYNTRDFLIESREASYYQGLRLQIASGRTCLWQAVNRISWLSQDKLLIQTSHLDLHGLQTLDICASQLQITTPNAGLILSEHNLKMYASVIDLKAPRILIKGACSINNEPL